MKDQIVKGIAAAVAGAAVSWVSLSLTLVGRVDAIEKALTRIEARLEHTKP